MKTFWNLIAYIFLSISPAVVPAPVAKTVTLRGETFTYAFFRALPSNISLIGNFDNIQGAFSLKSNNSCTYAVSGGFYDTKSQPLGYFVTNGKRIHNSIQSALLNGYIWIDEGKVTIKSSIPPTTANIALQSGPVLIDNSKPRLLTITNDEHARRVVVIVEKNTVIFLTIYNPDSVFEGPLLKTLPDLVGKISTLESFIIDSAINLDGGSASAFYSDTTNLEELTPVGSIFCVK